MAKPRERTSSQALLKAPHCDRAFRCRQRITLMPISRRVSTNNRFLDALDFTGRERFASIFKKDHLRSDAAGGGTGKSNVAPRIK